jgi:ferredoxin-NADP reductase
MATRSPATSWQTATVVGIHRETDRAKTFRLRLERPTLHLAGQHFVIRLTAPDGYTAMRSFSVASAPDGTPELEFTVERLDEGEVSTFLNDVVEQGDEIELRGPIGGWFVWEGTTPALLLGGGSGVVPLMAMLRLARRTGRSDLVRAIFSVRSPADLYYPAELPGPETTVVFTREASPATTRAPGRLRKDDIPARSAAGATAYVCGSTGFTNTATDLLMDAGWGAQDIRVERFGPTGTC